jgi:Uri superfamily endonuclease
MRELINSGSYAIIYYLSNTSEMQTLRFGSIKLKPGYYVYSGSAKKNLVHRVRRHIRKEKTLKWHVDYFSILADVIPKKVFLFESKSECEINQHFKNLGGSIIIDKFGATDCKSKCGSHFLYFKSLPKLKTVIDFGGIDGKLLVL